MGYMVYVPEEIGVDAAKSRTLLHFWGIDALGILGGCGGIRCHAAKLRGTVAFYEM